MVPCVLTYIFNQPEFCPLKRYIGSHVRITFILVHTFVHIRNARTKYTVKHAAKI